LCTIF